MKNRFRVYYSNGDVADSDYDDIPARDVQVIVQEHPLIGWHTQSGYDYYVFRDGRYVGVDIFGLYDFLLDRGDVLFGRTTTQKEFNGVMGKALADLKDAKHGWSKDEKRLDG